MMEMLSLGTMLLTQGAPAAGGWYGAYSATVCDLRDPDNQGRVKIRLPWSPDSGGASYEVWARLATMMGGNNRGSWFIPDTDDEVLVVFEAGDPRRPYVVGALWNGQDVPPETMDGRGSNDKKVLRSRNGVKITLDDKAGQETLTLETPGGQKATLKDGPGSIEIADSNGNTVTLAVSGITLNAAAKVTITASQVEVSACMVKVNAATSIFSGMVQCQTLVATTVAGTTYMPGIGNIL